MNHFKKKGFLGLALIILFTSSGYGSDLDDSPTGQVYVLVNLLSKDSQEIAKYYTTQRGIPKSNILGLEMSLEEEISIEEYVQTIHNPLLEMLLEKELVQGVVDSKVDKWGRKKMSVATHRIAYLVTTKDVPLKFSSVIEKEKANDNSIEKMEASVDSELSAILFNYYSSFIGAIENPLFQNRSLDAWRYSHIIRMSRLDGPSVKTIKRLIKDSIYAENYGLRGRAYFEVDLENTKNLIDYTHRLDAPAIYMGWYSRIAYQQWQNSLLKAPVGAIAYHLHSFSAKTIRTKKKAWVAPLLEKGYASTFGYVYEPFLNLTVRPDLFIESLLKDRSIGEAYAYANPALSWQSILIGDPLYRPFKLSLSDQLKMNEEGVSDNYIYLNEYYKNKELLDENEALAIARRRLFKSPNMALMITVARALVVKEEFSSAIHTLKPVTFVNDFQLEDLLLVDEIAQLLLKAGEKKLALKLYKKILFKNKLPKALEIKLLDHGLSLAYSNGDLKFSSMINKRILELKPE